MIFPLLIALFIKHFAFDFGYQPPFQWKNKGTYGHLGGIVHTGQHVIGSLLILLFFGIDLPAILIVCSAEGLIHYHMDWFKMNLNKRKGWGATTHNEFWVLTGFDQLVHSLTYVAMVWFLSAVYA